MVRFLYQAWRRISHQALDAFVHQENRMHPIVDRRKVTEKIENSVPARCYLQQELFFCQCREKLVLLTLP